MDKKQPKKIKCPRCKGKGERSIIVGPHVRDGIGFPGGPMLYECQMCGGTGKVEAKTK